MGWSGAGLCGSETRTRSETSLGRPEDAVNLEKRRNLSRIARRFLQQRRIGNVPWRFDVLVIDSARGSRPEVRLHKGAFAGTGEVA
jgi:Holliday junction resolvase-like predicted endonuclease